jgi:capsular polysaccharide biosynthesis protein
MSRLLRNSPKLRIRLGKFRQQAVQLFWSSFWSIASRDVLRVLPGSSAKFGPPRRTADWARYRMRHGLEWREVHPEATVNLPAPFFCNREDVRFELPSSRRWPAAGVAVIPGGRVLDEHGWAVGEDDALLSDFCQLGSHRLSRVNRILKLNRPRRLRGRILNLCTASGSSNYYHYVIEALGRCPLVTGAGFTWDDFDHILMPRYQTTMSAEIDQRIGLPLNRVIRIKRNEQFVCEILVQPSFPGVTTQIPPWVAPFFQTLFPAEGAPARRRVFLSREGPRKPTNLLAIETRLTALGFEKVDPLQTSRLRELMGEASHVVGIHGAALTNLIFCRPGTRFLEIMPTDVSSFGSRFYYHTLCASAGMSYGAVIGPSVRRRLFKNLGQTRSDFDVDLGDLDRGLDALLETARGERVDWGAEYSDRPLTYR